MSEPTTAWVLGVRVTSRPGSDIEIAKGGLGALLLSPEQLAALLNGPLHEALINALKREANREATP